MSSMNMNMKIIYVSSVSIFYYSAVSAISAIILLLFSYFISSDSRIPDQNEAYENIVAGYSKMHYPYRVSYKIIG